MSLRAELVGASDRVPGFALVLPPGWGSFDGDISGLRERIDGALAVLNPTQRAAIRPTLSTLLAESAANASRGNVIRTFAQEDVPVESFLPLSLVASRLDAPYGSTIAAVGAHFIAKRGAVPMDEAATILRWSGVSTVPLEGSSVEMSSINYLLPVPAHATHGLLFQANILRTADGAQIDGDGMAAMTALCDAIVSTVRWRRDG